MIALIDADSIIYIIAWHYKEFDVSSDELVKLATDKLVKSILIGANSTHYIGSFSATSNFRQDRYT